MGTQAGTLEVLAREVARALATLEPRLEPAQFPSLLSDLGLRLPPAAAADATLTAAIASLASAASGLGPLDVSLTAAIDADNGLQITTSGVQLLAKVAQVLSGLANLGGALNTAAGAPGLSPAERTQIQTFAAELPRRLFDFVFLDYLRGMGSGVVPSLALFGLADDAHRPTDLATASPLDFAAPAIRVGRLLDLLSKPDLYLRDIFGWAAPGFDGSQVFARVKGFLDAAGLPTLMIRAPGLPPILDAFTFRLSTDPGVAPPALTVRIRPPAIEDIVRTYPLNDLWSLTQEIHGRFDEGLEATIVPPLQATLRPPTGSVNVQYRVGLQARRDGAAFTILGAVAGTRLEAKRFAVSLGFDAAWDAAAGVARGQPVVTLALENGTAVIDTAQGDAFMRFLTGGVRGETAFALSGGWTPGAGLRFDGSSGLEIALPAHAAIGPVTINTVYVRAGVDGGALPIEISAALTATLGPIAVSIDGIGVTLRATFPAAGGNLGPLDIGVGFKAPTGIGLRVDGGGFKGGGFLALDAAKGQYAGALELEFVSLVTVKAIGILDTRLPNGRDGFSLLILISTEFIPIQLSFGFTLLGVGGLLGLNRTVEYDVLRAGVHDGALDSVLFPANVVANAPRIIDDLRRIFPPADDRFLIGPMAKLGWGTPTLASLELGLLLEIPRPGFAILGILRVGLPAEDAPLVRLQVNFLGVVDFDTGQLSFDASLFDSHALTFSLTGDMAVRLYTGENANFLLTVGGFHPAYTPPPMGLPDLQRLAIDVFPGIPRVRAEAYFAVTSNTVQFGARVEVYAGADIFNVYGFLGLDVLFQLSPFHFIAEFSAMLAVRSGSDVLLGVRVDGLLEGPTPWRARGTGEFEIGFVITVTIPVSFEVTFGDDQAVTQLPVDVLAMLADAVAKPGNWRAVLPANSNQAVSLRAVPADPNTVILHPFGTLEISQKAVPLNLPIARVGSQRPAAGSRFRISELKFGADAVATEPLREQFAPAQFLDLSDADKLSRQSFERYDGGVRAGGGDRPHADYYAGLEVVYETIYLPEKRKGLRFKLGQLAFGALLKGSAIARSAPSFQQRAPSGLGTPKVAVTPEQFAVATTRDLSLHGADLVFDSEAEAHAALRDAVERSPDLARELQVVPTYQVTPP
jgi:hypothetical protein